MSFEMNNFSWIFRKKFKKNFSFLRISQIPEKLPYLKYHKCFQEKAVSID